MVAWLSKARQTLVGATPEVSPSNRKCGDCLVLQDPARGTLEPGPSSLGTGPAVEQT